MKRLFYTVLILVGFITVAHAQSNKVSKFQEVKAKMEYSSKFCTPINLVALILAQTPDERINAVWLYGAMSSSKQLRTNEVLRFYASISNYTQVSALINQFKEFQNDACYTTYLNMNPDQIDISWLKLQVKDTALSYVFANR